MIHLLAGSNPVNGRAADIWSLGIVLYCFVHGRCPFENPSPIELSNQVIHDPLVMSENLSPALIDLLAGMLSKDPRTRTNISKIKVHAWVTNYGKDPMMTTEENCVFEEVTEEEVARAFIPAMVLVDKVCAMTVYHSVDSKTHSIHYVVSGVYFLPWSKKVFNTSYSTSQILPALET